MRLIVADAETYFSQDYSLSKKDATTESYVRDPRFHAHMWAWWDTSKFHAPGDFPGSLLHDHLELRAAVKESAVLCQHAHFDGLILSHHYGLKPKLWLDTLSMARLVLPRLKSHSLGSLAEHFGLPTKTVPYNLFKGVRDLNAVPGLYDQVAAGARHDATLTYEIFKRLAPMVPADELKVIDATIRMFTEPVLELDVPRMTAFLGAERTRKATAMLHAGDAMGLPHMPITRATSVEALRARLQWVETELQSSAKFAAALASIGVAVPMKPSPTDRTKLIPALGKNDPGMLAMKESSDDRVQALASARLGVKSTLGETRAASLLGAAERGAIPIYLNYCGAGATLRWSGGDRSNPQNWPRGGEIRKSIRAPRDHKLVIADLSQIEYRLLCFVAGQTDKLDALASGRDLYCEISTRFHGREITKADKPERGIGKQVTLSCGYGSGGDTIVKTASLGTYGPPVALSPEEGVELRDLYRSSHPSVVAFWRWCDAALPRLANGDTLTYVVPGHIEPLLSISEHKVWLPNGTKLDYTGLKYARNNEVFLDQEDDGEGPSWWLPGRRGWSRIWGSKFTADLIQALARVVVAHCLVRIAPKYRVVMLVHDEIVACVPAAEVEEAAVFISNAMRTPLLWCSSMPVECETVVSEVYDK